MWQNLIYSSSQFIHSFGINPKSAQKSIGISGLSQWPAGQCCVVVHRKMSKHPSYPQMNNERYSKSKHFLKVSFKNQT